MADKPNGHAMLMPLAERLQKYRMTLKQLDICQADLQAAGFIRDADAERMEKFIDNEVIRIDRALGRMGAPHVPALPEAKLRPLVKAADA